MVFPDQYSDWLAAGAVSPQGDADVSLSRLHALLAMN